MKTSEHLKKLIIFLKETGYKGPPVFACSKQYPKKEASPKTSHGNASKNNLIMNEGNNT